MASASRRRIDPQWSVRELVYRLIDGACIVAGLALAVTPTSVPSERYAAAALAGVLGFHLVAEISLLYRNWRGISLEREILCLVLTWALTWPLLLTLGYLARYTDHFSRSTIVLWLLATPVLASISRVGVRAALKALRARGYNLRKYAIVGVTELGFQLARNILESPELGLQFLGFYDDRNGQRTPAVPPGLPGKIGDLEELIDHARQRRVDLIYITFPMRAEDRIRDILARLGDTTASVYIVPDFFVFELLSSRWTSINGLPVVSVFENPFYGIDGLVKRAFDVVLAILFLLVAAVPMAVIAVLIKCTSPGPVFFRQRRYGLDGREIRVWKFRTMTVCEDGPALKQAQRQDPRVTRLGAFLRRTSLDELPQLLNVLEGTMSLVGPRPHASTHNEEYRSLIQGYMLRHKVKPGITGLAQVNGWRGETDTLDKMQRRIECDHRYIREWSLWMDIKILLKTAWVVLSGRNAY